MPHYMLARLKLKYGAPHLQRYDEAMVSVREFFEGEGVRLENAFLTSVGPLYQAWNFWRIDDPAHFSRATARLGEEAVYARYAETLATLADIVIEEELSLVHTMPFFATAPARPEA